MNQQQTGSKDRTSAVVAPRFKPSFSSTLYAYYYIHMILLTVLGSPYMMASMSEVFWLKQTIIVLNIITFVYCIYRLIRNKQLSIWCMKRMPGWMHDWMDRMPDWMHRWMNHTFMRVMMIGMDVMLAWMCVDFGLTVIR